MIYLPSNHKIQSENQGNYIDGIRICGVSTVRILDFRRYFNIYSDFIMHDCFTFHYCFISYAMHILDSEGILWFCLYNRVELIL
jgi:hypothetical protein